jgi:WhiB family redox-sensing transcriptional regulator
MSAERLYIELQKKIAKSKAIPPCQTTDPELWFGVPEYGKNFDQINYSAAKQFCNQCPVRDACLAYALAAPEVHGVWGGFAPKERQAMRNAHRRLAGKRGRPPKI